MPSRGHSGGRVHRERTQPSERARFGVLERKKDYKARAADYHEKQSVLFKLRKDAIDRNTDEFHHHMVNSATKDGQHFEKPTEDEDTLIQKQLSELKDLEYVKYALHREKKQIDAMQSELHLIGASESAKQSTHTIFVDDDAEAKTFEPVKFFDTDAELLGRKHNRWHKVDLTRRNIIGTKSKALVMEAEQESRKRYKELRKRCERAKELEIVVAKLELKKQLAAAAGSELKPKKEKKGKFNRAAVYKFPLIRKK